MSGIRIRAGFVLLVSLLITIQPVLGSAKVFVVTSTLDMADFTRQVGGQRVEVYPISTGKFDLHFFEPLPSQAMKLGRADLLVIGGLEIDAWIQGLIEASRNARIQFGAPGYVDPAVGVRPLDVPVGSIDGSMGDVHPYGNPHFWFTPENVEIAVRNITKGLIRLDPEGAAFYEQNRDRYLERVKATFDELQEKMRPFRKTAVLQYHSSWDYFCLAMGLEIVGNLEPKPGIPPTPGHLREVVKQARAKNAKLMLVEPYYAKRPVRFVEKQTGVKALRLPLYLGGEKGIETYMDNLRYIVNSIVSELGKLGTFPEGNSRF
jgi:zinc/manganese transport system substrate-binding protein